MIKVQEDRRKRRHIRVRRKVVGTPERPRLCVYKSGHHLYGLINDDISAAEGSRSLVQVTTNCKEFKTIGPKSLKNIEMAKRLGAKLGKLAKEKGIVRVAFDRSGYKYHGVVKAFAEAVRAEGIEF